MTSNTLVVTFPTRRHRILLYYPCSLKRSADQIMMRERRKVKPMSFRHLNVSIASIRFDKVPPALKSDILERTVLPLYGDILEWEYSLRRYVSLSQLEARVSRDLRGRIGEEVLRLYPLGLCPVLFVQFFSWELERFRIEIDHDTLRTLAKKRRSIEMTFPASRPKDSYGFEFSRKFIELLARYEFSLEIV